MFCFFHDQFIEEEKVAISVNDRGFSLGDGVFDTQLLTGGHLEDADLHFERLLHDSLILNIPFIKAVSELKTIASMLIARNGLANGRWVIRTQVTRGIALRGLKPPEDIHPTFIMRAMPAPPLDGTPSKVIVSQLTRRNEFSPLSRIKSLNYGDNLLALMEAQDSGVDDAILLNMEGFVACATTSNIFIVEGNRWVTPPVTDGVLPGITRGKLLIEKNAAEENIHPDRLKKAEEIWQCNSIIGTRRVLLA